eukprot:gene6246-6965_t
MNIEDDVSEYIMLLLVFVLVFGQFGFADGFIIDRPNDGYYGDIFSKRIDLPSGVIRVTNCGGIQGSSQDNGTNCQCDWGNTFMVDGTTRTPKCMHNYGKYSRDEGCEFYISGESYVKRIDPNVLSSNQIIGQVKHSTNFYNKYEKKELWYWNITWQHPEESNLFTLSSTGVLKWTASDSSLSAMKYKGLLFKFKVEACKLHNSGKCKGNYQDHCLLLKFTGSRTYPLPDPNARPTTTVNPSLSSSPSTMKQKSTTKETSSVASAISSTTRYPGPSSSSSFFSHFAKATPTSKASSSVVVVPNTTPTKPVYSDPSSGENKGKSSNAATIAGIVVGLGIAAVVFILIIVYMRKRRAKTTTNAKRKETLTLKLTANGYLNGRISVADTSNDSVKQSLGNPMYEEQLVCNATTGRPRFSRNYENAEPSKTRYETSDPIYKEVDTEQPVYKEVDTEQPIYKEVDTEQPIYKEVDTEQPIYKEVDTEQPIYKEVDTEASVYQETDGHYQPLSRVNQPEPVHYQPLDTAKPPRGRKRPVPPPSRYSRTPEVESAPHQLPVYQTVVPDAYQATTPNAVQNNDALYEKLSDASSLRCEGGQQPPVTHEPLYRELDNDTRGMANLEFENDECEI